MQKSDGTTLPPTRYTPFGNLRSGTGFAPFTDRDFTGQRENRELGLLYYQARYYLPGIGRFASADSLVPDPANPQSLNRYTYVLNSPLNRVDPTGHVDCSLLDGGADTQACNESKTNAATLSTPCLDCGWSDQFGDMGRAYEVLTRLEQELGRPVTYEEVLALVAYHEFGRLIRDTEQYNVALEAMGRQFYNFCGSDGICASDQLWKFLGAQQGWFGANPAILAAELSSGIIEPRDFAGARQVLEQPAYNPINATEAEMRSNWRSAANVSGVPFKYGNYSMFSPDVRKQLAVVPAKINGPAVDTVYLNRPDLNNGNGYVVMTMGQFNYWTKP